MKSSLLEMQFGAPGFLGVLESLVDGVEAGIDVGTKIVETRVINKDSYEYGDRRNTNGKGDLIGHRCFQNTLFAVENVAGRRLKPTLQAEARATRRKSGTATEQLAY